MKVNHSLLSILFLGGLVVFLSGCKTGQRADASKQSSTEVKFSCTTEEHQGQTVPATIANNSEKDKPLTIINWDPNNNFFGENWTPEKRCEEVSKRLQNIYDRDKLEYLTTDEAQWIRDRKVNVICSVKNDDDDTRCEEDDLLITLETKDDPNKVLDDLIAIREKPSKSRALRRGGKSQPKTFAEGKRVYYDLGSALKKLEKEDSSEEKPAF
jgi:hypothetical protein